MRVRGTAPWWLATVLLAASSLHAQAAPTACPVAVAPVPTDVHCPDGTVLIPGGTFRMGAVFGHGDHDQLPIHCVTLRPYCIDRTEVTVAAYTRCVDAHGCTTAVPEPPHGGCNAGHADRADHPINCVDAPRATAYCQWAHERLPTEAEWEFAARGTDERAYPWGNELPSTQLCWSGDRGRVTTCAVGMFPAGASPFGVLDMAGNVSELVSDRFGPYPGPPDVRVDNPTGPTTGDMRIDRGGGWYHDIPAWEGAAFRGSILESQWNVDRGVRCASDVVTVRRR